ncbi:hypothetical protein HED55_18985 [Ochrobactrum haematophilum]|uniref:Uncharacterized protein n=1 Tax=Brucella haematophila TaxID=419474 RepID=A0ABX1DNN7_9HYPH|nr:hypothetical protein [Brucella haematophila]
MLTLMAIPAQRAKTGDRHQTLMAENSRTWLIHPGKGDACLLEISMPQTTVGSKETASNKQSC